MVRNVLDDPQAAGLLLYAALFVIVLTRPRRRRGSHGPKAPKLSGRSPEEGRRVRSMCIGASGALEGRWLSRNRLAPILWTAAWGTLSVALVIGVLVHGTSTRALADASNRTAWNAASTSQYRLTNSDGITWTEIDSTKLSVSISPTVNSVAVLSADAVLFTGTAGYNQDLAICVAAGATPNSTCSNGTIVVWKEAGGFTAFKPATVYAQATYEMTAGTTYGVALYWKTNVAEGAHYIYDGAGGGSPYSPTSLSAVLTPTSEDLVDSAVSTGSQYRTSSTSWVLMDSTKLDTSFTPFYTGNALLTANADLFTGTSGTHQDLGICVAAAGTLTAGCGNGTVVSWAENGGASSYQPIAALVEGSASVTSGTQYTIGVVWRAGASNTIFAGAGGSSPYSLSSVVAQIVPGSDGELSTASTTSQLERSYSSSDNGTTWADMSSSSLSLSVTPATNEIAYLGGNGSLFANSGGYNIDLGICVVSGSGACNNVGWTESGSDSSWPSDANFLQVPYSLAAKTSYTIRLQWRTNLAMSSGNKIFSGAGSSSPYSPTTLSALLVPYTAPGAPTNVVARAVSSTDSDGRATVTWTAPPSPGSPITKYTMTPYVGTTAETSLTQTDTVTNGQGVVSTSYGVTGLVKGTSYTFQVTATNAAGTGLPGISNLVTPTAPPAYTIPGRGGGMSSPVITAPAKGYDNGKAAEDGTTPKDVVLGDVSGAGSGWPDLVTANGSGADGGDSLSALKNLKSTSGSFSQPAATSAPGEAVDQVALGNLFAHSDGVDDAVVVNGSTTIDVLENNDNGAGTFTQKHSYSLPSGYAAGYVAVANLHSTSGSTLDIVVVGQEGNGSCGNSQTFAAVLLGNGDGSFGPPTEYLAGDCGGGFSNYCSYATGMTLGDLNGAGLIDIV